MKYGKIEVKKMPFSTSTCMYCHSLAKMYDIKIPIDNVAFSHHLVMCKECLIRFSEEMNDIHLKLTSEDSV